MDKYPFIIEDMYNGDNLRLAIHQHCQYNNIVKTMTGTWKKILPNNLINFKFQ